MIVDINDLLLINILTSANCFVRVMHELLWRSSLFSAGNCEDNWRRILNQNSDHSDTHSKYCENAQELNEIDEMWLVDDDDDNDGVETNPPSITSSKKDPSG